ncbi:CHRD domain-containing protein [Lysobacter terrae]
MKLAPLLLALLIPLCASAADPTIRFRANLVGSSEVPSISTPGTGTFHSYLASDGLHYELIYKDLKGGAITQAHIHLGQQHTNGGIMAFLCSNLASPPPGTPACPASPGRVIGIISSLDVIGPAGQGVSAGDFRALIKAMDRDAAYANVHTATFPSGEIRGVVSRFEP